MRNPANSKQHWPTIQTKHDKAVLPKRVRF